MKRQHGHVLASRPAALLLSSLALPAAPKLAAAARCRRWQVATMDREPPPSRDSEIIFYGSTLEARAAAERYELALLEPPLDLLADLPFSLLLRRVKYCRWGDFGAIDSPTFLKPADPLDKVFDAGVYRERSQIRRQKELAANMAVLAAEPVEWLAEYRCFVLDGTVMASSPYLSFGRPLQHGSATANVMPAPVMDVCRRLASLVSPALPPAFVVDVGLIEDRGWAIVEFNPVWCAGLLSADADKVLDVLRRACRRWRELGSEDRCWVVSRRDRRG